MIKHAAIRKDNIIYVGHRHNDCIATMVKCGLSLPVTKGAEQGFVTDTGEFLDRYHACVHAMDCNQIIKKHGLNTELYSEDIY